MKKILLKFEIKVVKGMRLTFLGVDSSYLEKKDLDKLINAEGTLYKGEITIYIMINKVMFEMSGASNITNIKGSLNFTTDDKKVFKEDQEFTVKPNGRISWYKENVTLPI